jgi:hypothetical protein
MKLGSAQSKVPAVWRPVDIRAAESGASFTHRPNRKRLKHIRRREGRQPLRTNLTEADPAKLCNYYLLLVQTFGGAP